MAKKGGGNPYRDAKGRFSSKPGGGKKTAAKPGGGKKTANKPTAKPVKPAAKKVYTPPALSSGDPKGLRAKRSLAAKKGAATKKANAERKAAAARVTSRLSKLQIKLVKGRTDNRAKSKKAKIAVTPKPPVNTPKNKTVKAHIARQNARNARREIKDAQRAFAAAKAATAKAAAEKQRKADAAKLSDPNAGRKKSSGKSAATGRGRKKKGGALVHVPRAEATKRFNAETNRLINSLNKLSGVELLQSLSIDKSHYRDARKAKVLRNTIAQRIHPDVSKHPGATKAMRKLLRVFDNVIGE